MLVCCLFFLFFLCLSFRLFVFPVLSLSFRLFVCFCFCSCCCFLLLVVIVLFCFVFLFVRSSQSVRREVRKRVSFLIHSAHEPHAAKDTFIIHKSLFSLIVHMNHMLRKTRLLYINLNLFSLIVHMNHMLRKERLLYINLCSH